MLSLAALTITFVTLFTSSSTVLEFGVKSLLRFLAWFLNAAQSAFDSLNFALKLFSSNRFTSL